MGGAVLSYQILTRYDECVTYALNVEEEVTITRTLCVRCRELAMYDRHMRQHRCR
jgi:hypothetical protein